MHEDYPIPLTPFFFLRNTVLSFIFRPYVNRLHNNDYSEGDTKMANLTQ